MKRKSLLSLLLFILPGTLSAQTAAEILAYLKNNTRIYYLADANTTSPDIREIRSANIEQAGNNPVFGKTDNNRMDVSAGFLKALLTSKNGDAKLQKAAYDILQKTKK